jgi:hypothetical protein
MKVTHTSNYQGVEASKLQTWSFFQFNVRVEPDQPEDLAFINAVLMAGINDEELAFDPQSVTHARWADLFDHGALAHFDHQQGPIIRTPTGFKASLALLASFGSCSISYITNEYIDIKFSRFYNTGRGNLRIMRVEEDTTAELFEQRVRAIVGKLNQLDLRHAIRP